MRLKFSEIVWQTAGQRIFDVALDGVTVLTAFDVFADAHGQNVANDQVFDQIPAQGGQINVQFMGAGSSDPNAKVAAVSVEAEWPLPLDADLQLQAANDEFGAFYAQLALLAAQPYADLGPSELRARIERNEATDLAALAVLVWGDDTV